MTSISGRELKKLRIFPERSIMNVTQRDKKDAERKVQAFLNNLNSDTVLTMSFFEELEKLSHADCDSKDNRNRNNASIVYETIYEWCKSHGNHDAMHSLEKRGLVKASKLKGSLTLGPITKKDTQMSVF